jgi:2'-5' RNA ligase
MVHLFVAAWPTAEVIQELAAIPQPTEPGVRWIPRQNWHITLRYIGDADPDEVAARLTDTGLPRVAAVVGPAVEPLGRRQIVIPVEGIDALADAVRSATAGIGEIDRRPFRGHLTLARLAVDAPPSMIGTRVESEFEITEIALVASDRRPDGSAYTTLARFPTR